MRNELRAPRVRATLAGTTLDGLLSAETESNNHFSADCFRLQFAASAVQQLPLHVPGGQIEIDVGVGDGWTSALVGLIDSVSYDPILGTIGVEGRDLSAQMIETQSDDTFTNQTASEVALLIGLRHGLLVLADPTSTPIGRFYQSEHDRITMGQFAKTLSEWDLLAYLAGREGFDLFMAGRTLRFGRPVLTGAKALHVGDCISMHLGHAVGLARPIDVQVKSWNSKSATMSVGQALGLGIGPVWQRRITRPNLSSADAQQQAQRTVDDLKRHEWTATVTMPGEFDLDARSVVLLEGLKAPWNGLFRVVQLSRRVDLKHGFTQTLNLQGIA